MFTILLLLTFSDTPAVTPAEIAKVEAREAENMAKFKADKVKMDARAALLAQCRGDVARERAAKEAKLAAKQKLLAEIKKYGPAGKPLTAKEKAKNLYANKHKRVTR